LLRRPVAERSQLRHVGRRGRGRGKTGAARPPGPTAGDEEHRARFSSLTNLATCLRSPDAFGDSFDVGPNYADPGLRDYHRTDEDRLELRCIDLNDSPV
jgi:hypothetical protein